MAPPAAVHSDSFYERLALDRSASPEAIKRAYRELVRQYPPEHAPEAFKRIREAYETLSSPRARHEYDSQPDLAVQRWLTVAFESMEAKDYQSAERHLKQVLLQAPELGFVRNMLGLCFLYQERPDKAAAQFERLLSEPDAAAAWFGNAGHAYRELERYQDAEAAFEEAVRRATDSPVEYYIGLADVYLSQSAFQKAARTLQRGIAADGTVDFQDFRYFTKLLEVHILERSDTTVAAVLRRIREITADEQQRRFAAWKLGQLAQSLISLGGFSFAEAISRTARLLQPEDPAYSALEIASRMLGRNDHAGVHRLMRHHASFAPGGWLHELVGPIQSYCAEHRAIAQMKPIGAAPILYTVNGIGTTLYGQRDVDRTTGSHVTTLYFVVLFIPIFPIACYRVVPGGGNSWRFLGRVPYSKREKWHWLAFAVLLALLLLGSGSRSSTVVTDAPETVAPSPAVTSADSYDGSSLPVSAAPPGEQAYATSPAPPSLDDASDPPWYDTEKRKVVQLEESVQALDATLASLRNGIQLLRRQVLAIEGGYSTYSTSDPEYDRLIEQHNVRVREYNAALLQRRVAYRAYEDALGAFNQRVDEYNRGRQS